MRCVRTVRGRRGMQLVECALVLPFVLLLIALPGALALLGVRGELVALGAHRAARVDAVGQGAFARSELLAMLPPQLFSNAGVRSATGSIAAEGTLRPIVRTIVSERAPVLTRTSARRSALPDGLSNPILRGGDSPSPYCTAEGGYRLCGYPSD